MAQPTYSATRSTTRSSTPGIGQGYLFGVPVKDLGWFASLLIGFASGFVAFFAATFCGIAFILFYNGATHGNLNYAYSYMRIGLPVGALVAVVALSYLGWLWFRRKMKA